MMNEDRISKAVIELYEKEMNKRFEKNKNKDVPAEKPNYFKRDHPIGIKNH